MEDQDQFSRYNFVNGKEIDNYTNANGFFNLSDGHGSPDGLENALKLASEKGLVVSYDGDYANDYNFMKIAKDLGYKTQSEIQFDYFNKNLDERDLQSFYFAQQYFQTGENMDLFLQNIPKEHQNEAKAGLEATINYIKSNDFRKKIEKVSSSFENEKKDEIIENTTKLQILYDVFMNEEAKKMAEQLNKYSSTKVLFNLGNHEDAYFALRVRQYLENPEQLIDLTHMQGFYKIKQDNGEEINLAGMTNTLHQVNYLSEIFSNEQIDELYNHMYVDEKRAKTILSGNKTKDDLKGIEELIKEDIDYKRITKNGEENLDDLDIFLSHGQIGMPVLSEGKVGVEVPYFGSAAMLSSKSKMTIEGHIHSYYEGKNSFGTKTIRAAGEYGVIVRKDGDGNLVHEKIKVDDNYKIAEIPDYDIKELGKKVDEILLSYKNQPVNNLDYKSEERVDDSSENEDGDEGERAA